MERLRASLTNTLKNLGDSFSEDVCMDDVSAFVLSTQQANSELDYEPSLPGDSKASPRPVVVETDEDIINNIDASYFIEDDFDATAYELKKLFGIDLHIEDVDCERVRLKSQLQVVSKKISTLIMEKSPSYNAQIEDMDSINVSIRELVHSIRTIREALGIAQSESRRALYILANEKKKRLLNRLHSTLRIIKTLYETEFHLRDCIESGNFPVAIRLCLEAKEAANTYHHFSCVSDLMTKLVGSTNLIEGALDEALSTFTMVFDQDQYVLVYSALTMLNKVELASRKLVNHFVTTLRKSSRKIVEEHCISDHCLVNVAEMSYEALCERIVPEHIVSTVRELCYVMCKILTIYHAILRFHNEDDERRRLGNLTEDTSIGVVMNYMISSLSGVFHVALSALRSLLCCQDFSSLKFEELLDIVDMTKRFHDFGHRFFGDSSDEIAVSLEKQAIAYFVHYHSERVEELRVFLENECFTLCPVPNQFTIFDLQEFSLQEETRKKNANINVVTTNGGEEQHHFSPIPIDYINPFGSNETKECFDSRRESDRTSRSVEEPEDQQENASIDRVESIEQVPNICNTALNLLRFFGRYIRMTSLLPSISEYSVPALTELFEYFFYAITMFFGFDGCEVDESHVKIKTVLADIVGRLLFDETRPTNKLFEESVRFVTPKLCAGLDLSHFDQLYGIAERIVAVESVEFVARQLYLVRPVVESLLAKPSEKVSWSLDRFYGNVLSVVGDTRCLVYNCVTSRALNFPVLITAISNTKWDVDELQSHHSNYVDIVIKDFEEFSLRLECATKNIHLSDSVRTLLWEQTIFYTFKALVQGYCESGRCSTEGRALMQLDFQHLLLKLEPICGLHPIPHCAFVEEYIKAFYLSENGLEEWIHKHSEYTSKQMISLLSVATHVSRKARTRIISALSD